MGTRSGDLDPAVLEYLGAKEGLSPSEVDNLLNKQSGLLGLSGLTNDMRELLAEAHENNDRRARLAIDIFCYRARKYIGAYLAALGGADAIVFAGGIGENAPEVRARDLSRPRLGGRRARRRGERPHGRRRRGPHNDRCLAARGVGDPNGRGAPDRARHVPCGDWRRGPLLTNVAAGVRLRIASFQRTYRASK